MEAGLGNNYKEEREKKYDIYVEEYVLSYLKREADSLELSEIYFYGQREDGGRKILVYGAGREKEIAVFSGYELLTELVCRLTQAGPVFMVRSADGSCRATGFQVFYENNEAMQSFLIEWTGSEDKKRTAGEKSGAEITAFPLAEAAEERKKHTVNGAISVQLGLILIVLVAIVIGSTDSYDKMEQLGQSAKEVFFAIENQETEESVGNPGEQKEILVERDMAVVESEERKEEEENAQEPKEEDKPGQEESREEEEDLLMQETEQEEPEGLLKEEKREEERQEEAKTSTEEEDEEPESSKEEEKDEEAELSEEKDEKPEENTADTEEGEEALSRSISRYYEVKQGDTLYTISQEIYGDLSRVKKICEMNEISDPDRIRSGQKILLP